MQDSEKRHAFDIIVGLKSITHLDKLLLFKIHNLDNSDKGCFAWDDWFADLFNVHRKSINRCISRLEENGYITKTHPNGSRKIKVNLPNGNPTVTSNPHNGYPDSNPTVDYRTKEYTEEIEKRERVTPAFDFLKMNYKNRLIAWERKYKFQIPNYNNFIEDYNDTVELESIEFDPDSLFNFLCRYANGFIKNAHKYN